MAANNINFEVMVLQGGRWELHSAYTQDQQGQAIKDAKALENISTIKGVKVVRSQTDGETGDTRENNIYASSDLTEEQPVGAKAAKLARESGPSPGAKKRFAKKAGAKGKSGSSAKNMKPGRNIPQHVEEYDPEAADRMTFSFFRLIVRLLMVVLFSAIIAATVSGLGGIWLSETEFRASTQTNILNILLFGSFFLSVVWMSFAFLSKAKIASSSSPRAGPKPPKPIEEIPEPEISYADRVDFGEETSQMAEETSQMAEEVIKADLEEPGDVDNAEDAHDPTDQPDHPADTDTDTDTGADTRTEPGSGVAQIVIQKKEDSPFIKKQKEFVMNYLADSLESSDSHMAAMDNFNKFGVNLFIAGAVETLSQSRNLDGGTASQILGDAVKFMGFRNKDAEAFSDKIQGYLLADSKYMQMYQAGRSSMMTYLEGDAEGASTLAAALKEWNTRKITDKASGTVTVLFTDIAGSTNMTQTLGDALAQQVVRAHNKIVRDALHKFNGKEVKHTGDGIMASFSKTSNSVEAAADMQKAAAKHSAANPELPLGLKIGINAGEPIAEDDDLFGTTVQMAARIVDKAQAGQVFVSDIVQGLCGGKTFSFIAHDGIELKGFDGAITLHELKWDADALPAPVDAKPETDKAEPGVEIGSEIGADLRTEAPEQAAEPEIEQPDGVASADADDGDGEPETQQPASNEAEISPDAPPETSPEAPVEQETPARTPGTE